MRALKSIDSKYIVSIDIETVRLYDRLSEAPDNLRSAWAYKQKNGGVQKSTEELELLWVQQASLYAEFSKVCSCSMAFLDTAGTTLMCKNFTDTNELTILNGIADMLNRISAANKQYKLLAHSGMFFDFPFLGKRFIINGLEIPILLDHSGLKPWQVENLDSNELWRLAGTGAGSSLMALTVVLDLPSPKDEMTGSEVGSYYFRGDLEAIGKYCNLDSIATFNVFRRFKREPIFQFDEVIYLDDVSGGNKEEKSADEKQIPDLIKLRNTGELTDDIKEEIKSLVVEKGMTLEDKENLIKIVLAHYQQKTDKVADKKAKEKEVTEFAETLFKSLVKKVVKKTKAKKEVVE